ncbi:MAG TPA: YaiI/YqxD family protein [Chloroflexota bacterium]|nr:YaiI/YqxD family protein [Chloroflexota bacterium]
MRIWVDADAVPADVKEIILRASRRRSVETIFVANKNVWVGDDPLVSLVRVTEGPDAADAFIVGSSAAGDLCVTADIPLAARLVEKGLVVIDPRGELYSRESIGERVSVRDFMAGLRDAGVQTGGPPPFGLKAKQRFASLFDTQLTRALRAQP